MASSRVLGYYPESAGKVLDSKGFAMIARVMLVAVLLLAFPAWAQDVFTVGPVPVDATGKSAAEARELARLDGQRRAFRQLIERLTLATDNARLRVDDATLNNLVQDYAVANERSSAVRYLADLTFRFRADEIRRRLRAANIPFAETRSKPVVVLPVLVAEEGPVLWDSPNPWREAWADFRAPGNLVPLVVPVGDLSDLQAIDAAQAAAAEQDALDRIAALHGGGDVLITQARRRGANTIETVTTRYGAGGGPQHASQVWRANPGESEPDLMARAVSGIAASVEEAWKRDNLLRYGREERLTVSVPITRIDDWVAVRDRLSGVAAIQRADLIGLNRSEARVELSFVGDPSQLKLALAQRDLVLDEGMPGWTLRKRGAAQRP